MAVAAPRYERAPIPAVARFGKPRVTAPAALGDVLGELILTANDLLDPGRSEVDVVGRLLRLWWFARQDQARYALPRYLSLLTANPDPSSANYMDLDAMFQVASGGLRRAEPGSRVVRGPVWLS